MLRGQPPLGGLAAAAARRACLLGPQSTALPLVGAQGVGFVGFGNTAQRASAHAGGQLQKPVTPAKRGRAVHAHLRRGATHAQAVLQCPGLDEPLLALAQPRQRRAGQGIERPPAGAALVALQPVGMAVANHRAAVVASRTPRLRWHAPLDDRQHRLRLVPSGELPLQLCELLAAQRRDLPKQNSWRWRCCSFVLGCEAPAPGLLRHLGVGEDRRRRDARAGRGDSSRPTGSLRRLSQRFYLNLFQSCCHR